MMIYSFLSLILLNRAVTGVEVPCPEGYELVGDRCASACPAGYKASGTICVRDCDPESDVSCVTNSMTIRRRLGWTSWIPKPEVEVPEWVPGSSVMNGFVNGSFTAITQIYSCALAATSTFMSLSGYQYIVNILEMGAEDMDNFDNEIYQFVAKYWTEKMEDGYNSNKNSMEASCGSISSGNFDDVLDVFTFLMDGGSVDSLFRRRFDGLTGVEDLGDGDFRIAYYESDVERIAESMMPKGPEAQKLSQRRRQELLEENMHIFRNMLRGMPRGDDEDEDDHLVVPASSKKRRRIDAYDFTAKFFFGIGVTAIGVGTIMEFALGLNDRAPNSIGGFMTGCQGFALDLAAMGMEMGVTFMDWDDIEGNSKMYSFGADFPGLEGGCAINLIDVGGKVVGGGFSCGGGLGIVPITLNWMDCETMALY